MAASAFHTSEVVGRVFGRRCQANTLPDKIHQLNVEQLLTYEKQRVPVQF